VKTFVSSRTVPLITLCGQSVVKIANEAFVKAPPRPPTWAFVCSPDRIRTGATALRGRRARPLHNGAVRGCGYDVRRACSPRPLGYQDSNLD
jgi:hypothetical protein